MNVNIFYRTTSEEHQKSYNDVFAIFKNHNLNVVKQKNKDTFREQLLKILEDIEAEKIFFLVDDILFIEELDLNDCIKFDSYKFIMSFRMGSNLKFCYTKQIEQKLPVFISGIIEDSDKLCWYWNESEFDWSYPLSVDGNIFSKGEMLVLAKNVDFNTPNSFEGNLQCYNKFFNNRIGICYKKSKIFNIPMNKVQKDYENKFGEIHQDFLLEKWNRGFQLDYKRFYGFENIDAHQEVEISFIKRDY